MAGKPSDSRTKRNTVLIVHSVDREKERAFPFPALVTPFWDSFPSLQSRQTSTTTPDYLQSISFVCKVTYDTVSPHYNGRPKFRDLLSVNNEGPV